MPIGDFQEVRVADVWTADKIDATAEELFEILRQAKKPICQMRRVAVEFEEEIDVAAGGVKVAAGGGAEKLELPHAVLAAEGGNPVAMFFNKLNHASHCIRSLFANHLVYIVVSARENDGHRATKFPHLVVAQFHHDNEHARWKNKLGLTFIS